ncbi:MAG: hypothetical protein HKL80_11000 [Acidimicrobiales bacterium]|nr:hypothetical protein [Acidimicrobiales bacterium]
MRLKFAQISLMLVAVVLLASCGSSQTSPKSKPIPNAFVVKGFSSGTIYAISCFASGTCVTVGTSNIDSNGNSTPLIAIGVASKNSWHSVHSPVSSGTFSGLTCYSKSYCIAVGTNIVDTTTNTGTSPTDLAIVAFSSNGGSTWTVGNLPQPNGISLVSVACSSPTSHSAASAGEICSAVGSTGTTGDTFPALFTTTDNGLTWKQDPIASNISGYLNNITCETGTQCHAIGNVESQGKTSGVITLASLDGGQSWTDQIYSSPNAPLLESISCISASNCISGGYADQSTDSIGHVLGPPAVYNSKDDGKSWVSSKTFGSANGLISQVTCPHANLSNCELVGGSGISKASVSLFANLSNGKWIQSPATYKNIVLYTIDCTLPDYCLAGGTQSSSINGMPEIVRIKNPY